MKKGTKTLLQWLAWLGPTSVTVTDLFVKMSMWLRITILGISLVFLLWLTVDYIQNKRKNSAG